MKKKVKIISNYKYTLEFSIPKIELRTCILVESQTYIIVKKKKNNLINRSLFRIQSS